ncbi:MAG: DUF4190 domain-containing protein [Planctomycetaceae bacterium]|nr:DUF4190 domain-containing protein [Planctomycetales bacterium]MCB9875312.1 DUF4190 domain-containing protein [Planctomycetaceae bacterium]MCB9937267.1 DUF4190 domain-containing protein [Planctomycetaceae bacterium]
MSSKSATIDPACEEGFEPYRAISKSAVLSFILGLVAIIGLASPPFVLLALVSAILGITGYRSVVRYPNELTGKTLAIVGAVLGSTLFVSGIARHSYIYATEVPEGHIRISFADLQPDKNNPMMPVPPKALEFDGEKIFVKGYVYPDGQQYNIKRFVLVPDLGTCCFGGQPKLTDMIEVTLEEPLQTAYNMKKRKLAGELKVDMMLKPVSGVNGVYYQLKANYLR